MANQSVRFWLGRIVTLATTAVASVGAYHLGLVVATPGGPAQAPTTRLSVRGLEISVEKLNLGEVWESPAHTATVTVRNRGPHPVTISNFSTTCDCTGVEPKSLTIPVDGTADLSLTIDLTHRLPYHLGLAKREVKVRIDPVFQGDSAPTPGWEMTAIVRSRVSLDTSKLSFLDMCASGGEPCTRRFRAAAHIPLERVEVVAVPPVADVRVTPMTPDVGQFEIAVTPSPNLPLGPFRFDLRFTAVDQTGQSYRCATIPVDGEMQPATRIVPRQLLLGEHPVPGSAVAEVVVQLCSGCAIERVEIDSQITTVTRLGPRVGTKVRYRVAMQINAPGDHRTAILFMVRRPDGQSVAAKLIVSGFGESKTGPGGEQ